MSRRELDVVIQGDNRDKGKKFHLTEMWSDQGEEWAARALVVMVNAGAIFPERTTGSIATIADNVSKLQWPELRPLMAEMFAQIQYVPEKPGIPMQSILPGANSQIEEVSTRLILRDEVIKLHLGFSTAELLRRLKEFFTANVSTSDTPTSQGSPEP